METLGHSKDEYTFMHDGAPCLMSRTSMNVLNSLNLELLPIENCWSYLNSLVYRRRNNTVDPSLEEMIVKCIPSMLSRIKEVLKSRGGNKILNSSKYYSLQIYAPYITYFVICLTRYVCKRYLDK